MFFSLLVLCARLGTGCANPCERFLLLSSPRIYDADSCFSRNASTVRTVFDEWCVEQISGAEERSLEAAPASLREQHFPGFEISELV
jgi:hypothetical protein